MAEKGFFKQVSFPESLGAEDKGKLTVSATNPQLVTILPGTPNAHTFYFQDPKNPTKEELNQWLEWTHVLYEKGEKDGFKTVLCQTCYEKHLSDILSMRVKDERDDAPHWMTDREIEDLGFDKLD